MWPPACVPQDSLGGNAKTSLLVAACDAAEHVVETLQSLQFGLRAMCVRTQVRLQGCMWFAAARSDTMHAGVGCPVVYIADIPYADPPTHQPLPFQPIHAQAVTL